MATDFVVPQSVPTGQNPALPIHPGVLLPSEKDQLLEISRRMRISGGQSGTIVDEECLSRFVAPCPGLIEAVRASVDVCGSAGQTDVRLEKSRAGGAFATMLAADITIANTGTDGGFAEATGTFTAAADAEVLGGDVIVARVKAAPTAGSGVYVEYYFVPLKRAA